MHADPAGVSCLLCLSKPAPSLPGPHRSSISRVNSGVLRMVRAPNLAFALHVILHCAPHTSQNIHLTFSRAWHAPAIFPEDKIEGSRASSTHGDPVRGRNVETAPRAYGNRSEVYL